MSEEIRNLISQINNGQMKLPEMQRDYVWKSTQVRDLLDSLYRGYPTGTILRWETTQKVPTRDFSVDAGAADKFLSYYLLLDGQQRLTSLSAVLNGKLVKVKGRTKAIDILFNLDHPDKLENTKVATDDDNETENEEEDNEEYTNDEEENKSKLAEMNRRAFIVSNPLAKNQNNWISVTEVFSEKIKEADIIKRCGDITTKEGGEKFQKYIERFSALKHIEKQKFEVITLPSNMSYEEVTEIFVRVNSSGTKLKGSDLALAQITAKWQTNAEEKGALIHFNEEIEKCAKHGWDISIGIVVRTLVSILTGQSRFKVVGSLTKEELQTGWNDTKKAIEHSIDYLQNGLYQENASTVSSPYFLVLLSYIFFQKNYMLTPEEDKIIKKWFFIANAKGRYSRGSSESILDQDLLTVRKNELIGLLDNLHGQFGRLAFDTKDFENKSTNSGIFKTLFTLMRYNKTCDWNTKQILSMNNLANRNKIEFHHIFPQNLLKNTYEKREINDISNQTFIVKRTNVLIRDDDPAVYLPELLKECGRDAFVKHCIPLNKKLWNIDRYMDFIIKRRKLLLQMVNDYLDSLS